jgi:G patch domain-containing protein 1
MKMPDTTPFSHKERSGLKLLGTPVLVTVVDEATGEKSVQEREAFVPAWKQTVTDEQGRRRFHGAFTGGFSAGYFNTVGSKEGWTPASFSSSRDARAAPQQSVADFMDEEDLASGGGAAKKAAAVAAAAPKSVEHAMARMLERAPDDKDEGLVLMRKTGWRDGQGVGPLVRPGGGAAAAPATRERSEEPAPKRSTFGPALSREEIDEIRNVPVAPRDVVVPNFEPKNDTHGLGFDPFQAAPEFAAVAAAEKGPKAAQGKKPSRVAFGLGAMEEADDFDPFGQDDMAQYDRTAGERAAEPRRREANVEGGDERLCSDGRPPLPGFELGPTLVDKVAPNRIVVPPGWKPGPLVCENVLGDAQVPPALAKWALSQARKAALEMATRQQQQQQQQQQQLVVKSEPVRPPSPPRPVAPVANAMTPFPKDAEKQKRYQNWLVAQTGFEGVWGTQARPSAAEIEEFEAVRAKFAAVPAGMADRFAPAGAVVEVKNEEELRAAEFRKYGAGTTRTEEDWVPVPLLCRRWGVKDPFADGRRAKPESKSGGGATDIFPSLTRELEKQFGASYHAQMELVEAEAAARAEEVAARLKLENPEENVVPEVRPEDDVFAAIFERPSEVKVEEPIAAAVVTPAIAKRPVAIDVDAFVTEKEREKPKRERAEDDVASSSVLASIFGPGAVKKSKTVELLDKTSVVKEFVSGAILGDDKSKKKKKKKKKDKKDKKKEKKSKNSK